MSTPIQFSNRPLTPAQQNQLKQAVSGQTPPPGFQIQQPYSGANTNQSAPNWSDSQSYKAYQAVGDGVLKNVGEKNLPKVYQSFKNLDGNAKTWSPHEKAALGYVLDDEVNNTPGKMVIGSDEFKEFKPRNMEQANQKREQGELYYEFISSQ
jgi:hypothetical protein